ncbi:unnamed protein product, partial [marine sediment metagenome]
MNNLLITKGLVFLSLTCFTLSLVTGCQVPEQRTESNSDQLIDILQDLQTTNAGSAPLNPLAVPIGAGLAGIIAMLESLRRVEKGKRKYA